MSEMLPLGVLLRRARLARGFTQAELAALGNVTQGSISNYERGVAMPAEDTLNALAKALDADGDALHRARRHTPPQQRTETTPLATLRSRLVRTVVDLPNAAVWDHSGRATNGDLAFSHVAGRQVYIILVDGAGVGAEAAMSSVMLATFILGVVRGTNGVCWPSEVLEQAERVPPALGGPGQAAVLVALFDGVQRSLHHARTPGMPAPFLRDVRAATSALQGRASRLGRFREGEVRDIGPNAMLLLATDGVANSARAQGRPLWRSPDIRTWLTRARTADELIAHIGKRALTGRPQGGKDDMLVVALEL